MLSHVHQVFDKILGQIHVVIEIGKRHFRFDHPELSRVPWRVGVFRSKRRAERIHTPESTGKELCLQLSRDGQIRLFTKKIRVIRRFTSHDRQTAHRQSGDPEHLSGAFTVRAGNNWGM